MSIFSIHHITKYEYDRPVKESLNSIKIYPYTCAEQETLQHELIITDQPDVHTFTDYWGNKEGIFNLLSPHRSLTIESKLLIRTLASQDILFPKETYIHELDNYIGNDLHLLELARASPVKAQALMDEYITKLAPSNKSIAAIIADTCAFIFEQLVLVS